jgi:hypothetical protein
VTGEVAPTNIAGVLLEVAGIGVERLAIAEVSGVPITAAEASATGTRAALEAAAAGSELEPPPPQEARRSAVRLAQDAARSERVKNTSFMGVPSDV